MATLPEASVDAIVTDPPYALEFMGRSWDKFDGQSIDPAFGHWLAGFADGEGCFHVHKKPQGTFDCQFSISLRGDDMPILERCQRSTGLGTIAVQSGDEDKNPKARWTVSSKAHCKALRDLFRAFPLRAKKAKDFEVWSEALDAWLNHKQGEWDDMAEPRERLMAMRAYVDGGVRVDPFQMWCFQWGRQAMRVMKPGAHLLAFGGTRTYHRLVAGLEDAGFEIRDQIGWAFGSGFPKSKNGEWGGTALKPAWEPVVMARKPLIGTVEANWREHGTGALNIDGCRVGSEVIHNPGHGPGDSYTRDAAPDSSGSHKWNGNAPSTHVGRWPANIIHDGSDEVLAAFPQAPGQSGTVTGDEPSSKTRNTFGLYNERVSAVPRGDAGSAARFFYTAKASGSDRTDGLHTISAGRGRNHHPTVKPTDLMRYLCRLVTPPGGTVLDPFMGSGSTLKAADLEGFNAIGIELDPSYIEIARRRIAADAPLFADVEVAA